MKVIITGHTSGIGLNLHRVFTNNGHEVFGYSRSTGHDIENPIIRKQIIEQNNDCDLFINNAFSATGQTAMLCELLEAWQDKPKKIINISSKLSYFPLGKIKILDQYIVQKSKQNEIIQQRFSLAYPQIMNVIVGLVDTPMSSVFKGDKLDAASLAKVIYDMTTLENFYIQQLVVDVPGLDWKNIKGF